jgi:hypothetical protein
MDYDECQSNREEYDHENDNDISRERQQADEDAEYFNKALHACQEELLDGPEDYGMGYGAL